MKKCGFLTVFAAALWLAATGAWQPAAAQAERPVTVIIFRHADREAPVEGDDSDPDISLDGQRRAVRLARRLEKYKPSRIFSTDYARTVQTVTPLSRMRRVPVEFYEPGRMKEFAERLRAAEGGTTIAVVGHNSTTFELANLLVGAAKYSMPDDSDYGKIWILRLRRGRVVDRLVSY